MKKLFAGLLVLVAITLSGCDGRTDERELDCLPCEGYNYTPIVTPSPEPTATPIPEPTPYGLPETPNYSGFILNPPPNDQLIYTVIDFTVEFLHAFNSLDEELLRPLMTEEFFTSFQWYRATEPPYDVWGTFWDTLNLAGNFILPSTDPNTPLRNFFASTTFLGNFTPGGQVFFVFNIWPTENAVSNWIVIRDGEMVLPDRWNVALDLIYDGNNGFVAWGFGLTYDR